MANLTGSVTMATASFLNGTGVGVSWKLLQNISSIRSTVYGNKAQNVHQTAGDVTATPVTLPLRQLSTNGSKVVRRIGSTTLPGLVSSIPTGYEGNLNQGELYTKIINQADEIFGNGDIVGFFTNFSSVQGFANISLTFMQSSDQGNDKKIGNIPGSPATDYSGWITNGFSELVKSSVNLPILAADLLNLGTYGYIDIEVVEHLGRSTGLAHQLNDTSLILINDLDEQLIEAGVDLNNLLDDIYEAILTKIFQNFTDTRGLAQITGGLGIENVSGIKSLADLLNVNIMFPKSITKVSFNSFKELSNQLRAIGNLDGIVDLGTLGDMLNDLYTVSDLVNVENTNEVVNQSSLDTLITFYGNGTGEFGNVTVLDMMGGAANYIHEDTLPKISKALSTIEQSGETDADTVTAGLDNLIAAMNGQLDTGGQIEVTGPGAGTYSSLDDATAAIVAATDIAINNIVNIGSLTNEVAVLQTDYLNSATQLNREFDKLAQSDISINIFTPNDRNVLSFAAQGVEAAADTLEEYGGIGDYYNRVTTNDFDGEIVKTVMREALNIREMSQYGIPIVAN